MADTRINLGSGTGEALSEYAESARGKLNEIKDTVGHYYEEGVDKAKELERRMETHIQDHPLQSLLIAAGVGLLAGVLVGSLCRR
jgi:ElaB/YqjD/DUF883 family membrane-anchored ribosome-binding protein